MTSIAQRLLVFQNFLPNSVELIAVSKTKPAAAIMQAYDAGQRVFGENKAQEMTEKWEHLPKDIEWHMIGHLQRNKVKYIAPYVHFVHSVDSERLLEELNKQAELNHRKINCLIQVHIAEEDSKFGFDEDELIALLNSEFRSLYPNIKFRGLMGMATFTQYKSQIRKEFKGLKNLFDRCSVQFIEKGDQWDTLSMGMSGDFAIAIEEGSTMIRAGSAIFGER
jgi:PLP dependent protein